jgi:hypothetical protein
VQPSMAIVFPVGLVLSVSGQGIKMSIAVFGAKMLAKSNEAGSTPTTVTGLLSRINFRPTMFGSEANRLRQKLWLNNMAGGAEYLPWHSSLVNDLPIAGSTPSVAKKLSVTGTLLRRSGSPAPVISLSPTR